MRTEAHRPDRARQLRDAWQGLLRWREAHPVLSLYAVALFSRAVVLVAATLGGLLITTYKGPLAWTPEGPAWMRYLARWDSGFYLRIAEEGRMGYSHLWAFDPGYPLAMRYVDALLPGVGLLGAGLLVSAASFAVAVPVLYHLTARWFDRGTAWRTTALFTLLPGSFYFTAVYSDGLFTALVLGFFLALGRRRWFLAALLASLAGVTRPQGTLLPGLILLAAVLDRVRLGRWSEEAFWAVPLAMALPAVEMANAYVVTGDWQFQDHARSSAWPQVSWRWPGAVLGWHLEPLQGVLVHVGFALIVLAMLWSLRDAWRRRLDAPLEAHLWTVGTGAIVFVYSDPAATVRYLLPILGVTWMLGAWARTPLRFAFVALCGLVSLCIVAALFAAWYPFY